MSYYDITMRGKPKPKTPDDSLKEVIGELGRLVDAIIEHSGRPQATPIVNVDSPETKVVVTDGTDNTGLIAEIERLKDAIVTIGARPQAAPVVHVDNKMPPIVFPEMKIPDIRIPDIKMPAMVAPEIKLPDIVFTPPSPSIWKFHHKYDVYNRLVETVATPQP